VTLKIAWGITGSGDHMVESVTTMKRLHENHDWKIDVILSKEGETVIKWYKLWGALNESFSKIFIENTPNSPFLIGPLQLGKYDLLLICPATANTTAKIAHGIADSLLTNCVAQSIKAKVPVAIFPVDQKPGKVVTDLPHGRKLALHMRDIDVQNAQKLRHMQGITVLSSPADIKPFLEELSRNKA
jgi:archaeoflavoprotein AfpA